MAEKLGYVEHHNARMRRTHAESTSARMKEPRFVEEIEQALDYWDSVRGTHAGSSEQAAHWIEKQGELFAELDRAKSMQKFKTQERRARG
jgi:hypothetical protein